MVNEGRGRTDWLDRHPRGAKDVISNARPGEDVHGCDSYLVWRDRAASHMCARQKRRRGRLALSHCLSAHSHGDQHG